MSEDVTHELTVRFARSKTPPATKRAVLAWLAERGITNLAEGVIDGVASPLDLADEGFGEGDDSPVQIFNDDLSSHTALAEALGAAFGADLQMESRELPQTAWRDAWREDEAPIITERFVVVRPEAPIPEAASGREPLLIAAGEAFGSGRHATTEVALKILEQCAATAPVPSALDVGTGTGILLIAAQRLGFKRLVGTEIDAEALLEAAANAKANGVSCEFLETAALPTSGAFDLVIANILPPVLHDLMPEMAHALKPGGTLVLAGFIDKEAAPLIERARTAGLTLALREEARGWVGLAFKA